MIDYTLRTAITKIQKSITKFLLTKNIIIEDEIDIKIKKIDHIHNWDLSTAFFLTFKEKSSDYAHEFCEGFEIFGILKEVHKPGFINFRLDHQIFFNDIRAIIFCKEKYGSVDLGCKKISIDHTDTNPTGPAHVGHAKLAIAGDVIANFLHWCGADVKREFIVNDMGEQIKVFQKSLDARVAEHLDQKFDLDQNSYIGEYVKKLAIQYIDLNSIDRLKAAMQDNIMQVLKLLKDKMKIKFHKIWYESDLQKEVPNILEELQEYCYYYIPEKPKDYDNDDWVPTKVLAINSGEYKCILQKETQEYTYIASDIIFHKTRAESAQWLIDVFGSDHQLHGEKLKGLMSKIGNPKFNVILCAMVRILQNGQVIKMSKRSGQFLELEQLLEMCDSDALKFEILSRNLSSPITLDIEKINKFNNQNIFYYVQYCYARTCSVQKIATEQELWQEWEHIDFSNLTSYAEINLIKALSQWPIITQNIANDISTIHKIIEYARLLSNYFHEWWHEGTKYTLNRIFTSNQNVTKARLSLVYSTQIVLKTIFKILGVKPLTELSKEKL